MLVNIIGKNFIVCKKILLLLKNLIIFLRYIKIEIMIIS